MPRGGASAGRFPSSDGLPPAHDDDARPIGRSWIRLLAGILGGGVVLVLAVLAGILLFADRIAAPVGEWILGRVLPWPESTVDIASIDLHGLHGLTAAGVRLAPDPDGDALAFDTLEADFRLGELLRGPRRIRRLRIVGLAIEAVQRDTSWGWLAPFEQAGPKSEPAADAGPALILDRVEVAGARLLAADAGGQIILGVDPLDAAGGSIVIGGNTTLDIENASLRIDLPGVTDGYLGVDARVGLSEGVWRFSPVEVRDTAGGRLAATGTLGPTGPDGLALDLRVTGSAFHIAQLHPSLASFLSHAQRADIDATVGGATGLPVIDATLTLEHAGNLQVATRVEFGVGAPVLEIRALADAVDMRRATDGRVAIDPVVGTLTARLAIPSGDSLDGAVTLDLRNAAAGRPIRMAGEAMFTRGDAEMTLDARYGDFGARVQGRARPLDNVPFYDLTLTGRSPLPLPAAVVEREPAWEGPWDATVHVTGEGFSPDSMRAAIDARLTPVNESASAGPGTIRGRIAGGVLAFDARLALGGGTLDGAGTVRLSDARRDWAVSRLAVRGLALGPWIGENDPGRLTASGTARAAGQGLRAAIRVDSILDGRFGGLSGDVNVAVADGGTSADGRIARGDATVDLESLALEGGSVRRLRLKFAGVDPAVFAPGLPEGSLTGRLVLDPAGAASADTILPAWARDTHVGGRLDLEPSTLRGRPLAGGIDLRLEAGELSYAADLVGEDEGIILTGRARIAGSPLAVRVDDGRLRNVDLAGWSGGRVPEGRVNGTLSADIAGFDPATASVELELTLDSTGIGPVRVEHGTGTVALADGRATVRADGWGGGRTLRLDLDAELGPGGGWTSRGTTILVDSAFPTPLDTLRLAMEFATPDTVAGTGFRGALRGRGPLVTMFLDSIDVEVEVADDVLTLRHGTVNGPEILLIGSGHVPLDRIGADSADLTIHGTVPELGPLAELAGRRGYRGRATLNAAVTGPAGGLRYDAALGLAALRSGALEFDSMEVTIAARSDTTHWLAEVTARAALAGRRPFLVSAGGLPVVVGLGGVGSSGMDVVAGAGMEVTWNAGEPQAALITRAAAVLDGDAWGLEREARLYWGDGFGVDSLHLRSTVEGGVMVTGGIDPEGEQDLFVEVDGLPVQMRRRDSNEAIARPLDLTLRLTGPAAAPELSLEGTLHPTDDTGRPWTLAGQWNDRRLSIRASIVQPVGGAVNVAGALPLRLSLDPEDRPVELTEDAIDLDVDVTDFDLSRLRPLLDPRAFRDLEGRVRADVRVTGSPNGPQLEGDVAVTGFGLQLPEYGTDLASDRLVVTLAGESATLTDVTLRSGERGSVRITGGVTFPELTLGNLDLDATFDEFRAADSRDLEAVISGTLNLEGTLAAPVVRGRLAIDQAAYQLAYENAPSSLDRIELTEADYRELERRFGVVREERGSAAGQVWGATTLDLTVSAISNVWVRRSFEPAMAVDVGGNLALAKEAGGDLQIRGTVRVVEGRSFIEEFGRRFEIASGSVAFNGAVRTMVMDAEATYEPDDDVTITLEVRGDSTGFALELGSDPALEEADIISYIVNGRPSTDVQQFDENREQVAGTGADIVLSRISGGVEDLARQALGLDVVEIRQDGLKGLTLVAGRYVRRRLYIGFQQPVVFQSTEDSSGIDETEVETEYRVNDWLLANLSGSRSLARFFLEARYAY